MKYRVLNGFSLGAGRDVYPPDVVELDEKEAAPYVYQGRLVEVDDEPAPPPARTKPPGDKDK